MEEANFNSLLEEWIEHCQDPRVQLSSSANSVRECDAYRGIVSMGYEALPLIREAYDEDSDNNFAFQIVQSHGLIGVVWEIVGEDFSIPKDIRGRIQEMQDYTKNWLDENMDNYISGPSQSL